MKVANKFDCITSAQRNICPIKLRTYQFENRGRSARPRKCLNLTPLIGYHFVNLINVAAALGPEIVLTYPNQKYRLSLVKLLCGRIVLLDPDFSTKRSLWLHCQLHIDKICSYCVGRIKKI